jgi:ubiquinone/menaquinone biosynthesis C-methylase UbiE
MTGRKIKDSVEIVAEPWIGSPYYTDAEKFTFVFWSDESSFRRYFDELDLEVVIDLACGHGRHAELIQNKVGKLYLMDVLDENIAFCKNRLSKNQRIEFIKNDGCTFRPIEANSVTAIFCYDSMVHFSPDIVASYLADAYRVLKSHGLALFHHSNYAAQQDRHFGQNPHARNYMTFRLFQSFAEMAGLTIVKSEAIKWGNDPDLDRISLLRKD